MSTKIWMAWRVPISRLNEATDIIHQQMAENLYQRWKKLLDRYRSKHPDKNLGDLAIEFENKLADAYREMPFNFSNEWSTGFMFWLDLKYAYIVPYGDWHIKAPEWFNDFHYQDQTDRPDNVSAAEYRKRKNKWNELWLDCPTNRTYAHRVADPFDGVFMAFSDCTRRWIEEKQLEAAKILGIEERQC